MAANEYTLLLEVQREKKQLEHQIKELLLAYDKKFGLCFDVEVKLTYQSLLAHPAEMKLGEIDVKVRTEL